MECKRTYNGNLLLHNKNFHSASVTETSSDAYDDKKFSIKSYSIDYCRQKNQAWIAQQVKSKNLSEQKCEEQSHKFCEFALVCRVTLQFYSDARHLSVPIERC